MKLTDEQAAEAVELYAELQSFYGVTGSHPSRYEYGADVHMSSGVTTNWPRGNTYRMADTREIRRLVMSDGTLTLYGLDGHNPWSGEAVFGPITLTLISCSVYYGDDVDAANVRSLQAYSGVHVSLGYDRDEATLVLGRLSDFADDPSQALAALRDLVDVFRRLDDYPLISEEMHAEYELLLRDEAWSEWLRAECERDLWDFPGSAMVLFAELTGDAESAFREAYYAYEGNEWCFENARHIYNNRHLDALQHAAYVALGLGECVCFECERPAAV